MTNGKAQMPNKARNPMTKRDRLGIQAFGFVWDLVLRI
jgi:hypothetical protein